MRLCFPLSPTLTLVWILAWTIVKEISAFRKRGRASHVMRGFASITDMLPTDIKLYQPCKSSYECLHYIAHSHCDWDKKICTCQPYHVVFNNSMCLPASLLGFGCILDSQCRRKVPHSRCGSDGLCECEPNHLPLRRDKCLPPAKVDDYCLNNRQCRLADSYSYCKYIIPRIYGKCRCPLGYLFTEDGRCLPHLGNECHKHHDCEETTANSICQRSGKTSHCACREDFQISKNKMKCEPLPQLALSSIHGVSLGKTCHSREECQARDKYSDCINGICDCVNPSDACSARNRGCHKDTFQCRNGFCISWFFLCDRQPNCADNSDEDGCVPFNCPKEAFQCDDGTCLSRALVCNGKWECPDGSDEARCYTGIPCDRKAFRCKNGQCLPMYSFCNAVQDCADGSDEMDELCHRGDNCTDVTRHRCDNGRCRSSAVLCSGMDGCGDNSDETHCEVCYCKKP